jgi:hypothetical protein
VLKITAETKALDEKIDRFYGDLLAQLSDYAPILQSAVANAIRSQMGAKGAAGPGRPSSSSKLGRRSDALYDALDKGGKGNIYELKVTDAALELTTGISYDLIPYWRIHELGGTIVPKRAKALTIPVTEEADKALRAAGSARALDLVFRPRRKTSKPNVIGVLGKEVSGAFQVWFVLASRVTIPARPYIAPGLAALADTYLPPLYESLRGDLVALWEAS